MLAESVASPPLTLSLHMESGMLALHQEKTIENNIGVTLCVLFPVKAYSSLVPFLSAVLFPVSADLL